MDMTKIPDLMSRGEDNGCHVISRTRCKDDAMPTPESIEAKCGLCEYPAKVGASRKLRASGGRNDSGTSEKSSNTGCARHSSNHLAQPVGRRAIRHTRRIVGTLILDARAEFISPIPGRGCGAASHLVFVLSAWTGNAALTSRH
jgi:hypothetical protein